MDIPEIDFNGDTFRLGTLVPAAYPQDVEFPLLSSNPKFRVWSESEILDFLRNKPWSRRKQFTGPKWVINQRSRGSCNLASGVGNLRRSMALRGADDIPHLSWEFSYAQLVDGRDNGSALADGMKTLMYTGSPPLDERKHPINAHIRKRDYSQDEYEAAKTYRLENCFTFSRNWSEARLEMATVLCSGQGTLEVAVHVGNNFTKLDRNGFAGRSRGPGNHAVLVDDVEVFNGRLKWDMTNSWGLDYGEDGRAWLDDTHMDEPFKYHQFYAVMLASNPGD